jgi:hypothetical protein
MLAYDPLSFGTPLPLLQIPAQAIRHVSDKVKDANCTLAHYTQDCKTLADVKSMVSSLDAACFGESFVDVGYICKKCQMVYPVRDACLTHQSMACYANGGSGGKTMLKLEQLQYECRVCRDKFSTAQEAKQHCHTEAHKTKVAKFGASVLPSSASSSFSSSSSSPGAAVSRSPSAKPVYSSPSPALAAHSVSSASSSAASSPYRASSGSPAAATGPHLGSGSVDKDYTPPTFIPVPSTAPVTPQKSPAAPSTPAASITPPPAPASSATAPPPEHTPMDVEDSGKDDVTDEQVE